MYATTTTGHREHTSVSKDSRVLQAINMGSTYAKLIQTTTTTTEDWRGLSYSDAQSVCIASETSTLNGTTRQYLGSAKITVTATAGSAWATVDGCWGTKVTSQLTRMGDTNCYQVTRTTVVYDVTNYGGTLVLS